MRFVGLPHVFTCFHWSDICHPGLALAIIQIVADLLQLYTTLHAKPPKPTPSLSGSKESFKESSDIVALFGALYSRAPPMRDCKVPLLKGSGALQRNSLRPGR